MGLTTSGGMMLGLMSSCLCLVLCAAAFRTVAHNTKHNQLDINPNIIPPLVVKPIDRLTKGYGRANELLQLSHCEWSRLAETDTFHDNEIIDEKTGTHLQGCHTSLIMIVIVIATVMMNLLPNPQTSQKTRTTSNLPPGIIYAPNPSMLLS